MGKPIKLSLSELESRPKAKVDYRFRKRTEGLALMGYGSGRHGEKITAENCPSVDIYKLKRDGGLRAAAIGSLMWSRDGEEIATIAHLCTGSDLVLYYRSRQECGDWELVEQDFQLTEVDCHYGGTRTYVICSAVVSGRRCGRRVGKLFAGGRYFACRHCYDLCYTSQLEPKYHRLERRADKLRRAVGGEIDEVSGVPARPKGMWHGTYERKLTEIDSVEQKIGPAFLELFGIKND